MGGCCSSSQKFQLHGTPVYNYCPPALEEHESTTPRESSFSARLLVDVNLDTSIPDTYRSPPTPIPFDVVLGIPQSTNMGSDDQAYKKPTLVKVTIFDHVAESPKKVEAGFQTSKSLECSTREEEEDEDICPTCFNCGESGHMSRDCRKPRQESVGNCYKCGEVGHLARDCKQGPSGSVPVKSADDGKSRAKTRAYVLTQKETKANPDVVSG